MKVLAKNLNTTLETEETKNDKPKFANRSEFIQNCKLELQEFLKKGGRIKYVEAFIITRRGRAQKVRIGTIVSYQDGERVRIGWSQLHEGLDVWNKYLGVHQAIKRATQVESPNMSKMIFDDLKEVVQRAARHYKTAKSVVFHGAPQKNGGGHYSLLSVEKPILRVNPEEFIIVEERNFPEKS